MFDTPPILANRFGAVRLPGPEDLEQPRFGRSLGVSGQVFIAPGSDDSRSDVAVFVVVPKDRNPMSHLSHSP
jgi:hypothetical protein